MFTSPQNLSLLTSLSRDDSSRNGLNIFPSLPSFLPSYQHRKQHGCLPWESSPSTHRFLLRRTSRRRRYEGAVRGLHCGGRVGVLLRRRSCALRQLRPPRPRRQQACRQAPPLLPPPSLFFRPAPATLRCLQGSSLPGISIWRWESMLNRLSVMEPCRRRRASSSAKRTAPSCAGTATFRSTAPQHSP